MQEYNPLLIYDSNSWHYKLILWSFGKNFFMDSNIDFKALEAIDSEQLKDLTYEQFPKKYKAKTVNLCPYCRALVGATVTAPFLYLYRLFPHKERKDMTREEIKKASRRRTFLSLGIGGGINIAFGLKHLLAGEILLSIVPLAVGFGLIGCYFFAEKIGKLLIKIILKFPKRKPKVKKVKAKSQRVTPEFWKKLEQKHDVICPPIHFIDKSKDEEHT